MNVIWLGLLVASVLAAALGGRLDALSSTMLESAKGAVELAIGLIGSMALWLGLLKVVEEGGLIAAIARALGPLVRRLFPGVPRHHPAVGAMVMNFSANMLGLSNAATPFGLKAMEALQSLNAKKDTASDAMVLFLAINTAGIQVIHVSVLALRSAAGAQAPGAVMLPIFLASFLSMIVAVLITLGFQRFFWRSAPETLPSVTEVAELPAVRSPRHGRRSAGAWVMAAVLLAGVGWGIWQRTAGGESLGGALRAVNNGLLPLLVVAMLLYGFARGVRVYEAAVAGAKEGFDVAIRILPYLVLILVAIGSFRGSGLLDASISLLAPLVEPLGLPAAVLPQALIRPLSGSAALGALTDLLKSSGPDSLESFIGSVIYGSSETTLYVLAVYFGAVQVRRTRHAVPALLLSDLASVIIGVAVARLFF